MPKRNFIRLNTNDNYLSLGNIFRVIKEEAVSSSSLLQSDLFAIIFDAYNIADSTVNNYCTGFRAINSKYKTYFKEIRTSFEKDNSILIPTVKKIVELVEDRLLSQKSYLSQINNSPHLEHICNRLYNISKNDSSVSSQFSNELYKYLEEHDLYNFIVHVLFYAILEKKQPIYINEQLSDIIENNIYNTDISVNDIEKFVKIQLNSGILSIRGLKELAKEENPFACFEIASMEFYGIATGKVRYDKAYKYYKIAAEHNHPVANWAIGYLYINGYIGNKSRRDLYLALKYFNKSRKLNCSNAFNSLGLLFLTESMPHIKYNKTKAINLFERSKNLGNVYACNNLGKIHESEKDYKKAFEYYLISAEQGESWAANRIGEFYRKGLGVKKDLKKAFEYYSISAESPKFTLCAWSKYNLAKYFYENGLLEIDVDKNLDYSIELLEDVADKIPLAKEELNYIYSNTIKSRNLS